MDAAAAHLADARAALEANPPAYPAALTAVLAAWRLTRQPAIADLVDRISARRYERTPEPKRTAKYGTSLVASWRLARATDDHADPDPRVARALHRVLFERAMFQGPRARWNREVEEFAARLAAQDDVRFAAPLRDMLALPAAFPGSAADARARPHYTAALAALEASAQRLAPMPAELAALVARIAALVADADDAVAVVAPAASTRFVSASAAEAIAAVFAAPDDDDLRRVVGDRLIALGDPRGEYIALAFAQLDGKLDAAGVKRMTALYNKNAGNWSAAVAPIGTRDGMRFAKGFLSEVTLDKSTLGLNREMWDAALESPYWATVVQLTISERCPDWWLRAFLQSPRSAHLRRLVFRPKSEAPRVVLERAAAGEPWRLASVRKPDPKLDKALSALSMDQLRVLAADARRIAAPAALIAALDAAMQPKAKAKPTKA